MTDKPLRSDHFAERITATLAALEAEAHNRHERELLAHLKHETSLWQNQRWAAHAFGEVECGHAECHWLGFARCKTNIP